MQVELAGMINKPVNDQHLNAEKNKNPVSFKISFYFISQSVEVPRKAPVLIDLHLQKGIVFLRH